MSQCLRCGGVDSPGHTCLRDVEPWHGRATESTWSPGSTWKAAGLAETPEPRRVPGPHATAYVLIRDYQPIKPMTPPKLAHENAPTDSAGA